MTLKPTKSRRRIFAAMAALLVLGCNALSLQRVTQPLPDAQITVTDASLIETAAPALDSEDQLRILEDLWQIVNDEYLYEDFNGLDWNATLDEYRQRVESGLANEEFYFAMDEMIASLGDDHSVYYSPEQAAEEDALFSGNLDYAGIGILTTQIEDAMVVLLPFPDSPAYEAGIRSHDSILAADGIPIIDEEGFVRDIIRGPEGTSVVVTVQSPGENVPREITVPRQRISGGLPVPYQIIETSEGKRFGYILIATFSDDFIDNLVGDALEDMTRDGPLDGLIIDNRINEGGADTVLSATLGYFMEGIAGYFVNRSEREPLNIRRKDINGSQAVPLVVLVGLDTVSYGEVFAGVLKDLDRAYLIGETTDGNVETLYGYDFFDGSRAWIAHDSFHPLNNPEDDWEETGIIPDLSIPVRWHEVTFETDPAIQAAVDYLGR